MPLDLETDMKNSSEIYRRLLCGEATTEEYIAAVQAELDAELGEPQGFLWLGKKVWNHFYGLACRVHAWYSMGRRG